MYIYIYIYIYVYIYIYTYRVNPDQSGKRVHPTYEQALVCLSNKYILDMSRYNHFIAKWRITVWF